MYVCIYASICKVYIINLIIINNNNNNSFINNNSNNK